MDTLIYFYQTNMKTGQPLNPHVEEYMQKDYRLVRIGLLAEAVVLLQQNIPCEAPKKRLDAKPDKLQDTGKIRSLMRGIFAGKHCILAARILNRLRQSLLHKTMARKNEKKAEAQKKELLDRIGAFWGEEYATYCVCEPPVTYFDRWRFFEYRDVEWIERLLWEAQLPHFVVLGYCDNLREILILHARRMKSLNIYETAQDYCDDLEDLAEELFEEYGLTVMLHLLEKDSYSELKNTVNMPCNVLDFSRESKMSPRIAPKGSIWFDIDCDAEKQRRLCRTDSGIIYKSLTVPSKFSIIP